MEWTTETLEYALQLESQGLIDRECKACQEEYIPKLKAGKKIWEVFAPRHKALDSCKSGKHPHCTCDTCF